MSSFKYELLQARMKVGLKIWRYDSSTGDRALKEYELDAPEEATLLDCLDIVKDRQDGTLAFRKSCRMMICGSCGMRMDGARGARVQDAHVRDRARAVTCPSSPRWGTCRSSRTSSST